MKCSQLSACCLALLMLAIARPAAAVEVPDKTVGDDTVVMLWLDVEQVSPAMIKMTGEAIEGLANHPMVAAQGIGLPLGDVDAMVKDLLELREGFIKAGGQGLVMSIGMPDEEEGASPPFTMFAQTKKDADPAAMSKLFKDMSDGEMDATLAAVADGWHGVSLKDADGKAVTEPLGKPSKKAHAAFSKPLGQIDRPVMSFAFRMQEPMREMLAEMAAPPAEGQPPADPMFAMLGGMLQPLTDLDTLGVSYSLKDKKNQVDIQMVFRSKQKAQEFAQVYNLLLQLAPAMLGPQLQDVPGAPDVADINQMFLKMQMQGKEDTLTIRLGQDFFDFVEKLGEQMDNAQPKDDQDNGGPKA